MLYVLSKHKKLIVVWGVIFALLTGLVSIFLPTYFSAESGVLIISRDRVGLDPFTESKLAERIGENLAQIIGTEDFFNKVMETTGNTFDKSRWQNLEPREQRKRWHRDVQAEVVYGTNLIKLTVYSVSKKDAFDLAMAVSQTLVGRGWEYVGGEVNLKVVNSPLVSRWQARPNLVTAAGGGLVVGMALASLWLLRYRRYQLGT